MPLMVYLILITVEVVYMISTPIQKLVYEKVFLTDELFQIISLPVLRVLIIMISILFLFQTAFIFIRGRDLKIQQTNGNEANQHKSED